MRWALVKVALAVTAMVVVAFAVPLGLVVRETARDRAVSHAERQAAALGPALTGWLSPHHREELVGHPFGDGTPPGPPPAAEVIGAAGRP